MRFLKLTLFFGYLLAKKIHLSYEELIALPRSLSSWAWQPTKTQTFTSDLFNKKTSAVRIKASNPQPLDSSKISVLSFNKFPEIGQYEKPQELQESTPPGHLIFTLKVSSPFPPPRFFSGAEGATVLFIWVIFGSEVKLCDEGCQGISRTGSMNPGSTQVRGKTQIRVGPNATTLEVDVWQEKSLHPQGELETKRGVCSKFTAGV